MSQELAETESGLSQEETSFGLLVAQGEVEANAWIRAGLGRYSKKRCEALLAHPEIVQLVKDIRAKAESDAVMNLVERRKFLADVVRTAPSEIDKTSPLCNGYKETALGDEVKIPDKLKCIDLDSKLSGDLDKKKDESSVDALVGLIAGLREAGV